MGKCGKSDIRYNEMEENLSGFVKTKNVMATPPTQIETV